jgi:hypothetical protein
MGEKVARWLRKGRPPWAFRLKSRWASRPVRLEALEALGLARLPETLEAILPYLEHQDPVLRLAAARAAARVAQGEGVLHLGEALLKAGLPKGALLEVLLLLEDRAEPVVALFLEKGGRGEVWAALEARGPRGSGGGPQGPGPARLPSRGVRGRGPGAFAESGRGPP